MRTSPALAAALLAGTPFSALARDEASFISGPGTWLYVGTGLTLPLLRDGDEGKRNALRTLDALGTSVLLSEGLKRLTRVPRPDTREPNSFPSGHATAAFAVATMQASFHPKEAPLWFLGAALISQSRLSLRRHRLLDVAGGAALGYGIARWELSRPRGLILYPLIEDGSYGLMLSKRF